MALCMRQEYREAEEVINHALTLDSDDMGVRALTLKAMICEETGRKSEARKLIKRAAKLDPKTTLFRKPKARWDYLSMRLSVALWRYIYQGQIPEGARLKAAKA